jgi:hypothetical protein
VDGVVANQRARSYLREGYLGAGDGGDGLERSNQSPWRFPDQAVCASSILPVKGSEELVQPLGWLVAGLEDRKPAVVMS